MLLHHAHARRGRGAWYVCAGAATEAALVSRSCVTYWSKPPAPKITTVAISRLIGHEDIAFAIQPQAGILLRS